MRILKAPKFVVCFFQAYISYIPVEYGGLQRIKKRDYGIFFRFSGLSDSGQRKFEEFFSFFCFLGIFYTFIMSTAMKNGVSVCDKM